MKVFEFLAIALFLVACSGSEESFGISAIFLLGSIVSGYIAFKTAERGARK